MVNLVGFTILSSDKAVKLEKILMYGKSNKRSKKYSKSFEIYNMHFVKNGTRSYEMPSDTTTHTLSIFNFTLAKEMFKIKMAVCSVNFFYYDFICSIYF